MLTKRQMGLLGLGLRAGSVTVGTGGVRAALQRGDVRLVVVAEDMSARTEEKVLRRARHEGVPILLGPPSAEFGRRIGHADVQVVGVHDAALVSGIVGAVGTDTGRT